MGTRATLRMEAHQDVDPFVIRNHNEGGEALTVCRPNLMSQHHIALVDVVADEQKLGDCNLHHNQDAPQDRGNDARCQ